MPRHKYKTDVFENLDGASIRARLNNLLITPNSEEAKDSELLLSYPAYYVIIKLREFFPSGRSREGVSAWDTIRGILFQKMPDDYSPSMVEAVMSELRAKKLIVSNACLFIIDTTRKIYLKDRKIPEKILQPLVRLKEVKFRSVDLSSISSFRPIPTSTKRIGVFVNQFQLSRRTEETISLRFGLRPIFDLLMKVTQGGTKKILRSEFVSEVMKRPNIDMNIAYIQSCISYMIAAGAILNVGSGTSRKGMYILPTNKNVVFRTNEWVI